MQTIPSTLKPFFQEYHLSDLTAEQDAHTIIERVLQFGNRAEIKWLFTVYAQSEIADWVRRFGREKLPQPHRAFWQTVLEIIE